MIRLLLGRHAESEGNVDPAVYGLKGDVNVGITERGWKQAKGTGLFLTDLYKKTNTVEWPVIYLSSYRRPKQTLSAMLQSLRAHFPGEPKLYEDVRLVEKFFGAASALAFAGPEVDPDAVRAIQLLSKQVYKTNPFVAAHLFGHSTLDTFVRVKNFMDGTLARDIAEGKKDFLIPTHGAVIQAFIMAVGHIPMDAKERLGTPGNGDIIAIEGEPKQWNVKRIYDGVNGVTVDEDLLADFKPFSVKDLPPVPGF